MNTPIVTNWTTTDYPNTESYDAWVDTLNEVYGSWNARSLGQQSFNASVKCTTIGSIGIVECVCDPMSAQRDQRNIGNDDSEFVAFQMVLDGRENMQFNDTQYSLERGDIFVWDNKHPMLFEVTERLRKVSIVLPLERLRRWMPSQWDSFERKLEFGSASRMLLAPLISSIVEQDFSGSPMNDQAISEAFIAILAGGVGLNSEANSNSLKPAQLALIKDYISRKITDPALCISSIASANKISIRYLHWLFSDDDKTVSEFILFKRLTLSRKDILNPAMRGHSISDVAFTFGFSNHAHFSRSYKKLFEESPSDTRKNCKV